MEKEGKAVLKLVRHDIPTGLKSINQFIDNLVMAQVKEI